MNSGTPIVRRVAISLAPTTAERLFGLASGLLFAVVIVAVLRGRGEWAKVPAMVWLHLATICLALVLTPVLMWRRRGDRVHRQLGWVWAGAMFLTAIASFDVRLINRGGLSFIHILSAWTIIQVPVIVLAARRHNAARHRRAVHGMVIGALLIAGFFTFPFGRMLGRWLMG